ncbi:MAG: peptide-methionine (S)-S-oxide reductase MsrA [Pseudomonadota bacterium]
MKSFLMAALLLCIAPLSAQAATQAATQAAAGKTETAIFAGGCFWCSESDFEKLKGVKSVVSGYIGGRSERPTYAEVSSGASGHLEAVEIQYDPTVVSYGQLVSYFWRQHDFLDAGGQFCDRGEQYGPAIFTLNAEQARIAADSKAALAKSRGLKQIATRLLPASQFYAAEDYHQDYYKKSGFRYQYYRLSCGRDARMKVLWPN